MFIIDTANFSKITKGAGFYLQHAQIHNRICHWLVRMHFQTGNVKEAKNDLQVERESRWWLIRHDSTWVCVHSRPDIVDGQWRMIWGDRRKACAVGSTIAKLCIIVSYTCIDYRRKNKDIRINLKDAPISCPIHTWSQDPQRMLNSRALSMLLHLSCWSLR